MSPAKKAAKKSTRKSAAKRPAKKTGAKRTAKKATKKAAKKGTGKKATRKKGTRKKSTGRRTSAAAGNLVVATKVRQAVRGHNARMSSELVDAISAEVEDMVAKAARRARENGRSTIRPSDL